MKIVHATQSDVQKNTHGDPEYTLKLTPGESIACIKLFQKKRLSLSPGVFRENYIVRPKGNKVFVPLYKNPHEPEGEAWVKVQTSEGLIGFYAIVPNS